MRTHLFVSPGRAAFGEVILGLRLAHELHAAGDRVKFLAPQSHQLLLEKTPFAHGTIDPILGKLDVALPQVVQSTGCDSVVLLDLFVMLLALGTTRVDPAFLDHLGVPTAALDIWDLRRSDLHVDLCGDVLVLPPSTNTIVPHRLVPVPFARPDALGAYCALPEPPPSAVDRAAIRSQLGVPDGAPVVMLTTAQFQAGGISAVQRKLAHAVPAELVQQSLALDPDLHVLHVGPRAIASSDARYHHRPQVAPIEFADLMRASDLLLTPNHGATGISLALVLGIPALAVIQTRTPRFRVCPLGLYDFMSPILQGNPYASVIRTCEVDDVRAALRELLFDRETRSTYIASMRTYEEDVRRLPSGGTVLGSNTTAKP